MAPSEEQEQSAFLLIHRMEKKFTTRRRGTGMER
jgi:hypothetical protein